MKYKYFHNLEPGDKIYVLDPKPTSMDKVLGIDFDRNPGKYIKHEIAECEVVKVAPHPKSKQVFMIKFTIPNRIAKLFTKENLKQAADLGVENVYETLMVGYNMSMCTMMNVKPIPTQCATTKEEIELWMAKTK